MKLPLFGKKNKTEPVVEKKEEEKAGLTTENKEEDYSTTLSWSGKSYDTMVQEKEAVKEQQMIFQMMSLYVVCSEESIRLSSSKSRSSRQREDKRWPKRKRKRKREEHTSTFLWASTGHKEGVVNFVNCQPQQQQQPIATEDIVLFVVCWLLESFLVLGTVLCCCFLACKKEKWCK